DASCTNGAIQTLGPVSVNGNGTYQSPDFTANAAGTYRWRAFYTGDANNKSVSTACNAANEQSTVSPASPALVTHASDATAGGTIHDSATLSGGVSPGGSISCSLYCPSDASCTNGAIQTLGPVSVN